MKLILTIENNVLKIEVDTPDKIEMPQDHKISFRKATAPVVNKDDGWTAPIPVADYLKTEHGKQTKIGKRSHRATRQFKPDPNRTSPCAVCGVQIPYVTSPRKYCDEHRPKTYIPDRSKTTPVKTNEDDEAWYCKHCGAYTTHATKDHLFTPEPPKPVESSRKVLRSKCHNATVRMGDDGFICNACNEECITNEFLPGHEKSPEEIAGWKPEPTNIPKGQL